MKLNLKQVLHLNGISKSNFDSRRRRDVYGFMYEAQGGDDAIATYDNARNRFGLEHAAGIACIEYGTSKLGLTIEMADSIVSNNFGDLTEAISSGAIDPEHDEIEHDEMSPAGSPINHFFIGAIFNVVGRGHYAGTFDWFQDRLLSELLHAEHNGHPDHAPAGIVMIDATTVYRNIKLKMLSGLGI